MIDLDYIEKYRENNRIEAKKALGGLPKSIWETYSAFANTLGGVILLGVEEINKCFHPINLPAPQNLIDEFWMLINDKNKVNKNIITKQHIQILRKNDRCFIAIFVPRASKTDMPIYIDKDPLKGTYKRDGEGDYRAGVAEILSMQKAAKELSPDFSFTKFSFSDLNEKSIDDFFNFFDKKANKFQVLKELGILDSKKKPSYAGLLVFGKYDKIKKAFPDFKLSLSSKIFKGNLFDFFKKSVEAINDLFQDKEICLCLREALLNAITNADYFNGAEVEVEIFASHISFKNSGAFTVDLADAKKGFAFAPRNLLIKKIFDLSKPLDTFTGGIPYIHLIWQKNGFSAPYFYQTQNETLLKLYFYNIDFLNDNLPHIIASEIIICYLTEHIYADKKEFAKILNLSIADTETVLEKLYDNNLIVKVEKNNNTLYKLKD